MNDAYALVTGKDMKTGKKTSRAKAAAWLAVGFLPIGKVAKLGKMSAKGFNAVSKGSKAAKSIKKSRAKSSSTSKIKAKKNSEDKAKAAAKARAKAKKKPGAKAKNNTGKKATGAKVNKTSRNLIDNMDEIADDIRNINKKYSSGLEQNNSIDSIINYASYYEDVWEQTSAVTRSVAEHAFVDGNKRTAFETLNMLLDDLRLKSPLNDTQKWDLINRIGTGDLKDVSKIANILKGK